MSFPDHSDSSSADGHAPSTRRKHVPETGSFGKSTRRSRSKTGTPARREDPTILAADAIFGHFGQKAAPEQPQQRRPSVSTAVSQPNLPSQSPAGALATTDGNAGPSARYVRQVPTEVILRGYNANHEYAAISHYERIGGRICEDYSREPPPEIRRYKYDARDPAVLRRRPLTAEERAKAMHFAGGEHWIKVTFESAEAADRAITNSPQLIQGFLVYAEPYRGVPPNADEPVPADADDQVPHRHGRANHRTAGTSYPRQNTMLPRSYTTSALSEGSRDPQSLSPPGSFSSSNTLDTATLSSATSSSATLVGQPASQQPSQANPQGQLQTMYCRRIPTAKRAQLLPADQALLPQPSFTQKVVKNIPLIGWLSTEVIGSEVPRTEMGEFDWARASLYWKIVWYLDNYFRWFGDEVAGMDKDE